VRIAIVVAPAVLAAIWLVGAVVGSEPYAGPPKSFRVEGVLADDLRLGTGVTPAGRITGERATFAPGSPRIALAFRVTGLSRPATLTAHWLRGGDERETDRVSIVMPRDGRASLDTTLGARAGLAPGPWSVLLEVEGITWARARFTVVEP
jgi:hypothetical protein